MFHCCFNQLFIRISSFTNMFLSSQFTRNNNMNIQNNRLIFSYNHIDFLIYCCIKRNSNSNTNM